MEQYRTPWNNTACHKISPSRHYQKGSQTITEPSIMCPLTIIELAGPILVHRAAHYTVPRPKGDGQSLMVSDFLTVEWGCLCDNNRCVNFFISFWTFYSLMCREARIMFKTGKNRNRYFDAKELLAQVNHMIDIFESKMNGLAQGLHV